MPGDVGYRISKQMEKQLQLRMNALVERPGMTRENPEYVALASELENAGRAIDDYEAENRVTDEQGQLLKPPATRTPAMFQPEDQEKYSWYFEPSAREAREALKRDPALLQRLDPTGEYSHAAPTQTQVYTAEPGIQQTVQQGAGETWLDRLTDSDKLYNDYAEHAWKQRLEKARSRYEGVKRYKNVPLEDNSWEYIKGGVRKGEHKFGVPGMLGSADAMSAGQASPLYDVGRDLSQYQIDKLSPEEQEVASAMGFGPRDIEDLPSSQDIINRSVPAYVMGNLAAGGFRGNPSNVAQEAIATGLGYGGGGIGKSIARGAAMLGEDGLPRMVGNLGASMARAGETSGGKFAISAGTGAVTNAGEGAVQDFSRALEQNASPIEAAGYAAGNVPMNAFTGLLGAGLGEVIGQTAGAVRNNYRDQERMRIIKPFEEAGGELKFGIDALSPTPEMEQYRLAANKAGAVGTAGERASAQVAQDLRNSYEGRAAKNQEDIEAKKQEYFEHPAYKDKEISAAPAISGLVQLAGRGWTKGPVTGAPRNMDMGKINRLGDIIKKYTDEPFVLRDKLAQEFAQQHNGIVINGDLANQLYKFGPGKEVTPGFSVVAVPINVTAENLTHLEELIDEELKMASRMGSNKDPIWTRLNRDVKGMRDQFRYYVDDNDNLVPPPGWVDPSIPPKPPSSGDEPVYEAEFADSERRPPTEAMEGPMPPSSEPPSGGAGGGGLPEGGGGPMLPPAIPRLGTSEDTPLSLLAGNKLLLEQGTPERALQAATEPRINQLTQGGQFDEKAYQREYGETQPTIEGVDAPAAAAPDERGALERMLDQQLGRPSAPDLPVSEIEQAALRQAAERSEAGKAWKETEPEAKQYLEGVTGPGRAERSGEAQKIQELTNQQQAVDDAMAQVNDIDRRLGPVSDQVKEDMFLSAISKRLGYVVTREDLVKAGLIAGTAGLGLAYDEVTGDEDGKGSLAATMIGSVIGGGGGGRRSSRRGRRGSGPPSEVPPKPPRELEATLDNGDKVTGFSALRHQQHLATTQLERTKQRLGVNDQETIKDRVRTFNQRKDRMDEDEALLQEAINIGKEKELRGAAGAAVYQQLRDRSTGGDAGGFWRNKIDALRLRLDNPLGKIAGHERNPFAAGPPGAVDDYLRELFKLTGGRGYRYGDELRMLIDEALQKPAQDQQQ